MAKKSNSSKDYFGLSRLVSLILAIIPITAWIFGFITRFKEGHWICGIIRVLPVFGLPIWILDLICIIFSHHIFKLF